MKKSNEDIMSQACAHSLAVMQSGAEMLLMGMKHLEIHGKPTIEKFPDGFYQMKGGIKAFLDHLKTI